MDAELEVERFLALPEELQEEILSWRPDLLATLSQTSHYFRRLTWTLYLTVLEARARDINYDEGDAVTRRGPIMMGTCGSFTRNQRNYITRMIIYHRRFTTDGELIYDSDITEVAVSSQSTIKVAQMSEICEFEDTLEESLSMLDIDLLREYRVRQRRLGCMVRDPGYARRETLRLLDVKYQLKASDYLGDIIELYMFLYMNAWIFNLELAAFRVPASPESAALKSHNDRLYHDVRRHLLRLE